MQKLISFLQEIKKYKGGNTEFAEDFNRFSGEEISAKALKQMMNRWRYSLEENGVFFESSRSNGQRFIKVEYRSPSAVEGDESVVKDGKITLP